MATARVSATRHRANAPRRGLRKALGLCSQRRLTKPIPRLPPHLRIMPVMHLPNRRARCQLHLILHAMGLGGCIVAGAKLTYITGTSQYFNLSPFS